MSMAVAASSYNGDVTGTVTVDGSGVVTGGITGAYTAAITGTLTSVSSLGASFTGSISGDIVGTLEGGVNYNGHDTLFAEITGTGASGYVYLIGDWPDDTGVFQATIVTVDSPIDFTSQIVISGAQTVQAGCSTPLAAETDGASQDVAWSVWTGPESSYGAATIDQSGLLTGTSAGQVVVIASALDGSLVTQNYVVTVMPKTSECAYVPDPTNDVPEFGLFALIGMLVVAGLFLYRRRQ